MPKKKRKPKTKKKPLVKKRKKKVRKKPLKKK